MKGAGRGGMKEGGPTRQMRLGDNRGEVRSVEGYIYTWWVVGKGER